MKKMIVKGVVDEDFINYRKPSMFIACKSCTFKCDKLNGRQVCQNGALANSPEIEIDIDDLVEKYLDNDISTAVVFGGLEPFDDIVSVIYFIELLRHSYNNNDDVVIYTGYTEEEIVNGEFKDYYEKMKSFGNIIIKYGRFITDSPSVYDDILGVKLSSDNQYAKRI